MRDAEQRWEKVVADFRQLCLLRRQKKFIESDIILTSELPRAIAAWSEAADGDPAAKKSRLDAMFQTEQRRIDDVCLTMDILSARLKEETVPTITTQISEQLRASVGENLRATILQEVRASIADEIRAAVAAEVRAAMAQQVDRADASQRPVQSETQQPRPALRIAGKKTLVSNFAEQVRTTVAQKAFDAVMEEFARDKRPVRAAKITAAAKAKPAPAAAPVVPNRLPMDDVPGIIDFVLAQEQHDLKNKYKFELAACP